MLFGRWKTQELSGASPLDPHWSPLGPFIGLMDPTPQGSRALPPSIFLFLINGAPNHPLPTGTLKQSYATDGVKTNGFNKLREYNEFDWNE